MARSGEKEQRDMARALDRMKRLEEFEQNVLPRIRDDLTAGLSADDIYSKYENMAAARAVTIALMEPNPALALAAIKDIRDRKSGRATEKKEVTHKMARLKDEELDALLLTELSDIEDGKTPKKSN